VIVLGLCRLKAGACVNVGENGLLEGVRLVNQLLSIIHPRALVIKSSCIRRHAGEMVAAYSLLS